VRTLLRTLIMFVHVPADCCYRLATLKYAPQHSGDAGASEGGASMPSSGDMRGAFDQVRV
jgi:hypothetical protein